MHLLVCCTRAYSCVCMNVRIRVSVRIWCDVCMHARVYACMNVFIRTYCIANCIVGALHSTVAAISQGWGQQIQLGATCFWETFSPQWTPLQRQRTPLPAAPPNGQNGYTSMCHPWGSGVLKFISENILGIRPIEPGFATYQVGGFWCSRGRLLSVEFFIFFLLRLLLLLLLLLLLRLLLSLSFFLLALHVRSFLIWQVVFASFRGRCAPPTVTSALASNF